VSNGTNHLELQAMPHKRPVRDFNPASDPSIDLLHLDAAAAMLGLRPGHLLELVEAGAIRAVDLKSRRIDILDLEAFIASRKQSVGA
jgi:hypothetical protein